MATKNLAIDALVEASAGNVTRANVGLHLLDAHSCLEVIATQNAPGTATDGNVYIVGAAGSGAWSGHNNEIAVAVGGGWYFQTPQSGMTAFDVTLREYWGYSDLESAWFPIQDRWSTTEHWTGRYHGGTAATNKVWSKSFAYTGPASGAQNTAHSISNLNVATSGLLTIEAYAANGTTVFSPPLLTTSLIAIINVNATNIVTTVAGGSFSAYTFNVRLCYRKTA